MAKQLQAHEDFTLVTVLCNGVPLALNAEVEVTIKRPVKLDAMSQRAWNQLTAESAQYISIHAASVGKADQ